MWTAVRGTGSRCTAFHHFSVHSIVQRRQRLRPHRCYAEHSASSQTTRTYPLSWLVVGDGDLSYSASLAQSLADSSSCNIHLTASVLEDVEQHRQTYADSQRHYETILRHQQHAVVHYGINTTRLFDYFANTQFDRIIWHFPHVTGKNNIRYNRQLIHDFLQSAQLVLTERGGQIHMALCGHQGGMDATSSLAWKQSWMVAVSANECGLLLSDIQDFVPHYKLCSHRGMDRAFRVTKSQLYVLQRPHSCNDTPTRIDERYQISYRHEVRIAFLNSTFTNITQQCLMVEEYSNIVLQLAKSLAPTGIDVTIPLHEVISSGADHHGNMLVLLVMYSGASLPLTRTMANGIRSLLEQELVTTRGWTLTKRNRQVSKPFPRTLLPYLLQEYVRKHVHHEGYRDRNGYDMTL